MELIPLTLQHLPLSVTFAIFNNGRSIIVDPTLLEEALADGILTIVMNHLGELCYLGKTGNVLLDALTLMNCVRLAKTHMEALRTQVRQACPLTGTRKVQWRIFMDYQCSITIHFIEHEASHSKGSLHRRVVSESPRNRGNAWDENRTTENAILTDQPSLFMELEKEVIESHGWSD